MRDKHMALRVEMQLYEDLKNEASKRGQTVASLVRTFLRDGLSAYNSTSEQLLKTENRVEASLKVLEALAGASLWVVTEQRTRRNARNDGESEVDYAARLQSIYRKTVKESLSKGGLINKAVRENDR